MDREAGILPREQQLDALLAQQPLDAQKGDHLVPKEGLRGIGIDLRRGNPSAITIPTATRNQGVYMRTPEAAATTPQVPDPSSQSSIRFTRCAVSVSRW
jgi:hypothetical protein